MTKAKTAASIEAYICDDNHFHFEMKNERDAVITDVALDFDDGLELVQGLLAQLEEMTGLIFAVIDPDDEDEIGPVMGSC